MSKKHIVLAAGGTGGHLFPALSLGHKLKKLGYKITIITDLRCSKYLNEKNSYGINKNIIDLHFGQINAFSKVMMLIKSIFKSLLFLLKNRPALVIGFGGYPSAPPMVAALLIFIPIIIHEQNCFLSKTNKLLSPFAKVIALSYDNTLNIKIDDHNRDILKKMHSVSVRRCSPFIGKQKIIVVNHLLRDEIAILPRKQNFEQKIFHLTVIGGSQGASIFDDLIPKAICQLISNSPNLKLHITQQVSSSNIRMIQEIYDNLKITHQLSNFFNNLEEIYMYSDLIISRAGASTIAEISAIGLPAILVPLPTAKHNHQYYNAKYLEDIGASWCYKQDEINADTLAHKLLELISDRTLLSKTSSTLLKANMKSNIDFTDTIENIISS